MIGAILFFGSVGLIGGTIIMAGCRWCYERGVQDGRQEQIEMAMAACRNASEAMQACESREARLNDSVRQAFSRGLRLGSTLRPREAATRPTLSYVHLN